MSRGSEALVPDGSGMDVDVDGEVLVLVGAAEAADLFVLESKEAEGVDGAADAGDGGVGDVLLLSDEGGDPGGRGGEGGDDGDGTAPPPQAQHMVLEEKSVSSYLPHQLSAPSSTELTSYDVQPVLCVSQ